MKTKKYIFAGAIAALLFCALPVFAKITVAPEARALQNNFREIAKQSSPTVVYIATERKVKVPKGGGNGFNFDFNFPDLKKYFKKNENDPGNQNEDDGFRKDFNEQKMGGIGSGMIITADGYVLTNYHVIEDAVSVKVILTNEKKYEAEIKGYDARHDIAIIKIKSDDKFPVVELGDSERVMVGDIVLAVGNPFGYENTVTMGIVSAKGRLFDNMDIEGIPKRIPHIIQLDAPINPGNSGGPLFNLEGEVIGINMAIGGSFGAGSIGNMGVGFAIPINDVKAKLKTLMEGKKNSDETPWVGVRLQEIDAKLAKKLKVSTGVLITEVDEKGPGKEAGLKSGDVIIRFDGKEVLTPKNVVEMVAAREVGETAVFKVIREGKEKDIKILLAPWGEKTAGGKPKIKEEKDTKNKDVGITVKNFNENIARKFGIKSSRGVIVMAVEKGSPADKADIQVGDLVKEIDSNEITDTDAFYNVVKAANLKEGVLFVLERAGNSFYVVVSSESK